MSTGDLQSSWDEYKNSCICAPPDRRYANNCAHFLSNALILGGFSDIDGGKGADMREVKGFCVCPSGRPIRAKELRKWFGMRWTNHREPQDGINLVYQERLSDRQGHVALKEYRDGKLIRCKGTGDYPGWEIQEYYY